MGSDERQFLMTAAWMFARHGQRDRARTLCRALQEDDPRDGVVATNFADLLLEAGQPQQALAVLRQAVVPPSLERVAVLLEGRTLVALGRKAEAQRTWQRYVDKTRGVERSWVSA